MSVLSECLIALGFCGVLGSKLHTFALERSHDVRRERCQVFVIGLGFLFGSIWKALINPVPWIFLLYYTGVFLAYTTLLFSLPNQVQKENHHE